MHERRPDQHTVLGAITLANRAPSLHNAQPWHWLIGDTSIHLMAGQPPATDRRRFSSLPVPVRHVDLMAARAAKAGARLVPAMSLVGAGAPVTHDDETGELLVLTTATATDDLVSVLRAGEAASAALLTATSLGLATRTLSPTRDAAECPLLILRTGWAPATTPAPPRTPRRATGDTVGYLPGTRHGYSDVITTKSPWPP